MSIFRLDGMGGIALKRGRHSYAFTERGGKNYKRINIAWIHFSSEEIDNLVILALIVVRGASLSFSTDGF
jgi:hypothetical protein